MGCTRLQMRSRFELGTRTKATTLSVGTYRPDKVGHDVQESRRLILQKACLMEDKEGQGHRESRLVGREEDVSARCVNMIERMLARRGNEATIGQGTPASGMGTTVWVA